MVRVFERVGKNRFQHFRHIVISPKENQENIRVVWSSRLRKDHMLKLTSTENDAESQVEDNRLTSCWCVN